MSPRKLLAIDATSLIILIVARFAILSDLKPTQPAKSMVGEISKPINTRKYRPIFLAKNINSISVKRIQHHLGQIPVMNDRGDLLYYNVETRKFELISGGIVAKTGKLESGNSLKLKQDGTLSVYKLRSPPPGSSGDLGSFGPVTSLPYNEARFFSFERDDRSNYQVRYSEKKSDRHYSLLLVPQAGEKKAKVSELYHSKNLLITLEIGMDKSLWVQESGSHGPKQDSNNLIFILDKQSHAVAMPDGYHFVDRVATGGSVVAGTFGYFGSTEPIRSFRQQLNSWKELRLPEGAVFSFVQKVFTNGLILGFVTDANFEHMRQVAWDGDDVTILNDQPDWPKQGKFSYVIDANRNGDVLVDNELNDRNKSTEIYLVHISRKSH